jgi:hypothetical protein
MATAKTSEDSRTGIERLLDEHLKGLMLPEHSPAEEYPVWLLLLVAGIILLVLIFLWRWYQKRNSPSLQARRQLRRLQGFASKTKNHQSIAIQLSSYLRQGLQTTRLDLYQPRLHQAQKILQWQTFLYDLETASYSNNQPSIAQLNTLFKQSHDWLKQA